MADKKRPTSKLFGNYKVNNKKRPTPPRADLHLHQQKNKVLIAKIFGWTKI